MEPTRETHYTLVDLLDRVLDKGVVLYADVIVSVAGIPLLGVNLRAALAGMETMISYGVMQEWDQKVRAQRSEIEKQGELSLNSKRQASRAAAKSANDNVGKEQFTTISIED